MIPSRIPVLALWADVVAIIVFAAVGRVSHGDADTLVGLLLTAAPFLVGLGIAWAMPLVRAAPAALPSGGVVLGGAVVFGLALRAAFTGRLPLTFVAVTVVTLAVLLVGWRALALLVERVSVYRAQRALG